MSALRNLLGLLEAKLMDETNKLQLAQLIDGSAVQLMTAK